MGYVIKPIECHGGCLGCYEKSAREAGFAPKFDLGSVLSTLDASMALDKDNSWHSPTLHGGEPLSLPIEYVEAILERVFLKYGKSGIQTSGAQITAKQIELFDRYKTHVGVSIDGDRAETNAGRWNAPGFDAAKMTEKTLGAMRRMKAAGVRLSAIVLLRRYNAGTPALRQDLVRFGLRLRDEFGVTSARFNPAIGFDRRTVEEEELDNASLADAFKRLAVRAIAEEIDWRPVRDFIGAMSGKPNLCELTECDPWHSEAEMPILGDGSIGVCLKGGGGTDGVATLRTEQKSRARYEALAQVKQADGGCAGCYWWPYCKGGCPGAGIGGEWRKRTRFCEAYKETFGFLSVLDIFTRGAGPVQAATHGDREHGDSDDPAWRAKHPEWKGGAK